MTKGGARHGAGRPKGQGRYGESTKAIRVPESMVNTLLNFITHKGYKLPLFSSAVSAGFPDVADDYMEARVDLNELLVRHPTDSFLVRVSGNSMIDAGIHDKDIILVDRSVPPTNGKIVVAAIDGQLTVKRLQITHNQLYLIPENEEFSSIEVKPENDIHILGVVTHVIHPV